MSAYKQELDGMVWSFSRLHSYEQCPYSFYMRYIEGNHGESNFYAENGKICHEILQSLADGTLELSDAPSRYYDDFECIVEEVSQKIMDSTFETCMDYFCEVDETALDRNSGV